MKQVTAYIEGTTMYYTREETARLTHMSGTEVRKRQKAWKAIVRNGKLYFPVEVINEITK